MSFWSSAGGAGAFGAIGSAIGGAFGALGQSSANKANRRLAREQMAFQERMSNTAYQRAARDMEAAGLNRILAIGNPATTPGGQTATMGNVGAALGEGIGDATSSALGARLNYQQYKNLRNQADNTSASTDQIREAISQIKEQIKNTQAQTRVTNATAKLQEIEAATAEKYGLAWPLMKLFMPGLGSAAVGGIGGAAVHAAGRRSADKRRDQKVVHEDKRAEEFFNRTWRSQ